MYALLLLLGLTSRWYNSREEFHLRNLVSNNTEENVCIQLLEERGVTDTDANLVGHMEHLHLPFHSFLLQLVLI